MKRQTETVGTTIKTVKQSRSIVVVGKDNSKMPGTVFSISAKACITGSKLVNVDNSVCSKCYALRIENFRPNVAKAWTANLESFNYYLSENPGLLIEALVFQINRYSQGYHRWFDSGDLQSVDMLRLIVQVCRQTPTVNHWLPTREAGIVSKYLATNLNGFPNNLVVRVSAPMIDGQPIKGYQHTSTVHRKGNQYAGVKCPARDQGNQCLDCRSCWDKSVPNVSYVKH